MELYQLISLLLLCFSAVQGKDNGSSGQASTKNNCNKTLPQYFETPNCLLCRLNAFIGRCPSGTQKITRGMGIRKCILSSRLYGCVHICKRKIFKSVCCKNYWGPNCQPCPGLSGNTSCFGNGQCNDLEKGNGTCLCNGGFEGFACELCSNKMKFGLKCEQDCSCKNGNCDSGISGNGTCIPFTCKNGYHGENCENFEKSCPKRCSANSHCAVDKSTPQCKCNPGYTGNGSVCTEIDPCKDTSNVNVLCAKNTVCQKTGPGLHKCVCRQGYTGDGVACSAIDPCQRNNGNCPQNTRCNYLGPGKSNCSCLAGFDNYDKLLGCKIINLCVPGKDCLTSYSECVMTAPNVKECKCRKGYVGNGTVCYGNILQRIDELHSYGPFKNKLRHVKNIIKHHSDLTFAYTERGPFTVFVPTDPGLESKFSPSQLAYIITDKELVHDLLMVHSALAYLNMSSFDKRGELTTLKGWAAAVYSAGPYYQLNDLSEKPKILKRNILASNGIIHVINGPAWIPDFTKRANMSSAQLGNRTIWEIITQRSELQKFRDYIQIAGMQGEFEKASANDITVIAPLNESFSSLAQMDREFLNSSSRKGKAKLRAIIRHHIFGLKIGIFDLSFQSSLMSKAPELVNVSVLDRGAVLLAGKSKLIDNNILASNGFVHITNALLIPSFVLPIVSRHCNDTKSTFVYSKCRPCNLKFFNGNCPRGSVTTDQIESCRLKIHYFVGWRIFQGCKTKCRLQIKKCCPGFYGDDCTPCPGPVGHPCFDNGKCTDGLKGNGTCRCNNNFKETACELCKRSLAFGLDCTKSCTCLHGTCDSGRYGSGSCRPGTCKPGYSGKECDTILQPCTGSGGEQYFKNCSVNAKCYVKDKQASCKCNAGYEEIGNDCYEIDPCLKKNRGGCDKNAACTKTGAGKNKCTCFVGWTGDGYYCTPINYCAIPMSGHCHKNAKCTFLGPAQARCDCRPGYEGDGVTCKEINTCLKNNGGCSSLAKCIKTGPGQNNCSCRVGYIGDGFICRGSLAVVVKRQRNVTIMSSYIVKYNLDRYIAHPRLNITVFLPSDAAISNLDPELKKKFNIPANLYYFGGANIAKGTYMSLELRNKTRLQALFKNVFISINHTESGEPLIGGIARIVTANITASNGVLHIVDKVLFPNFTKKPRIEPSVYEGLCGNKTHFRQMCDFIKKFKLEDEMKNCTHCTIFAPTNEAFDELRHDHYYKISGLDILYHMTNHYIHPRTVMNEQQFTSLAGHFYKLALEKGAKRGQVKVNGIPATYNASNSMWFIYTVGTVLKAVQNHCYRNLNVILKTQCRPCQFSSRRCRPGFRYAGREDCFYRALGSQFLGCRALCSRPYKKRQCCPGFWGKDCTACPGENNNPCFGNGKCHGSITGNGHCECNDTFNGIACERCKNGNYGKDCKHSCNCSGNATCDEDGFCLCPLDKKGLRCDQKADNTPCDNVTCAQHASCIHQTCRCDLGFTGNGTICNREKLCEKNNGGCSPNAKCHFDASMTKPKCTCKIHYEGDGYYCQGKNPCLTNPIKCLRQADCWYKSPGRYGCTCKAGYTGDGRNSCEPIDSCSQDNGNCSFNAKCTFDSSTFTTSCTCADGYTGDGKVCVGNVLETLQNDANLAEFYSRLKNSKITEVLSPENHVSVIAPENNAFASSSRRQRRGIETLSDSDLKYYIISCVSLSENDVNGTSLSFVTVAGSWLNITSPMVLNNKVKVLSVKSVTNSAILVVDRLLDVPQQVQLKNRTMTEVAKGRGYGMFIQLFKAAGLDITSNIYSQPYTMFWPTNDAISRLPEDIKKRLLDANYRSELKDVLNYHIVEKTKITTMDILSYSGGLFRRSREGSPLYISCKGYQGDLFINDRSKIIERDVEYQEGIAFGISEVLLPPGIAGRCDEIKYEPVTGNCTACGDYGICPPGTILESVDKNSSCVFEGRYTGCFSRCVKRTKVKKCCRNFYGTDCVACPGEVGNPCSGHGICHDGSSGSGNCTCHEPFLGTACEYCKNQRPDCDIFHSKVCASRLNPCSIFATCVLKRKPLCQCLPRYKGDGYYCEAVDKCQKKNGDCNEHALCKYLGPNLARCECRSGYIGDGYTCTALPPKHPCAINNGPCHVHAKCFDKGGNASCHCREGFNGNGYFCGGSVKDVIYDLEELSEFAKAFRKLSFGVEGNALIRQLSSEKGHTVFAPINYGFTKSMTINDLKNHIVPEKLLFKPGTTRTVPSLARNKITIVVSRNNAIRLNNIASVVAVYPAANGIVVVIDHIIPFKKPPPTPPTPPTPRPSTTETPTSTPKLDATAHHGSVNTSSGKNNRGVIIGVTVGVVAVVILTILAICFLKKRRHPKVKYNKNFESMFESEAYADEDGGDDDDGEYEHQELQHPSSQSEGTTVTNPTFMTTDEDISDEFLEMTERSNIVPLTEHDVTSC